MFYQSPKCSWAERSVQGQTLCRKPNKQVEGGSFWKKATCFLFCFVFCLKAMWGIEVIFLVDKNVESLLGMERAKQDPARGAPGARPPFYGTELWFPKVCLRITWRFSKNEASYTPPSVILIQSNWILVQVSIFLIKYFMCCFKVALREIPI